MVYDSFQPGGACALARDPQTIFIYWDQSIGSDKLNGAIGANVRAIIGWALKVKCLQENHEYTFEVDPKRGSHYLCELHPGWSYDIRLCQMDTMGEYHTLCRCGTITLEQAGFSPEHDPMYPVSVQELVQMLGSENFSCIGSSDGSFLF